MQPTKKNAQTPALHVAIIMDGNGRWAAQQRMPRFVGHRRGAEVVRKIVTAAPKLGITTLTLYAFSSDNWQRPAVEVKTLMRIFRSYLETEAEQCIRGGVRVNLIGRRDRLGPELQALTARFEAATACCTTLHLRLAIDYSAREAIVAAARKIAGREQITREAFAHLLNPDCAGKTPPPDVDLLIRTGGEQRLSDFLLWECAYAELFFTKKMWPDFTASDLAAAIQNFHARERRFGRVSAATSE